jgi:hypothetical protein
MSRNSTERWAAIEKAANEHSPLFLWMRRHHDRLLAVAAGSRLRWQALVREFAVEGLTDANGNPPSPETARKTWQRVRIAVAAQRERARLLALDQDDPEPDEPAVAEPVPIVVVAEPEPVAMTALFPPLAEPPPSPEPEPVAERKPLPVPEREPPQAKPEPPVAVPEPLPQEPQPQSGSEPQPEPAFRGFFGALVRAQAKIAAERAVTASQPEQPKPPPPKREPKPPPPKPPAAEPKPDLADYWKRKVAAVAPKPEPQSEVSSWRSGMRAKGWKV